MFPSRLALLSLLCAFSGPYTVANAHVAEATARPHTTSTCTTAHPRAACSLPLFSLPTYNDDLEMSDGADDENTGFDDAMNDREGRSTADPLTKPILRTIPTYAPVLQTINPTITQ